MSNSDRSAARGMVPYTDSMADLAGSVLSVGAPIETVPLDFVRGDLIVVAVPEVTLSPILTPNPVDSAMGLAVGSLSRRFAGLGCLGVLSRVLEGVSGMEGVLDREEAWVWSDDFSASNGVSGEASSVAILKALSVEALDEIRSASNTAVALPDTLRNSGDFDATSGRVLDWYELLALD